MQRRNMKKKAPEKSSDMMSVKDAAKKTKLQKNAEKRKLWKIYAEDRKKGLGAK